MLMSGGETFFGCECSSLEAGAAAETEAKLSAVLEIMRPKPSPFELLRIGGGRDGAYLVPDDLKTVKICFSPGVSNRKRFEDQLTADYGMTCHMCDYSSDETKFATPLIPGKQTFDKLWLEPRAGADQIDLRSWIDKFYPGGGFADSGALPNHGPGGSRSWETDLGASAPQRPVPVFQQNRSTVHLHSCAHEQSFG